jgi:ABC-type polysaccharide/polyol phosphate transport system ATPase subunit
VGFNLNLSGRENIIVGGLASGLNRRQVMERSEAVIDFAGIEEFIDAPMRTYSSGMFSRLAFSVAVHMDPDILMIDEALSAGDAAFKTKAAEKMKELRDNARAMFLVSHSLASITELCNDVLWLHKGEVMRRGKPEEVVEEYKEFVHVGSSAVILEDL